MLQQGPSRDAMSENAALLSQLRQGDSDAWHTVTDKFRQRLRDLAAATLPSDVACRADASDMVQQTLTEANASLAAFCGDSMPELFVWMAAILNHNVSDAVRRHLLAKRRTVKAECNLDDSSQSRPGWEGICAGRSDFTQHGGFPWRGTSATTCCD